MGSEEIADRLKAIAEELSDLALDRLREATTSAREHGIPDPHLVAEEKRLTRARNAVEKAAAVLRVPEPEEN